MEAKSLIGKLETLHQRPQCEDWATKIQKNCEAFWLILESTLVRTEEVDDFIKFLINDSEALSVVMLVIPSLRVVPTEPLQNPHQQRIATEIHMPEHHNPLSATQGSFDDPPYRAEKEIFLDSQLHRARLLLQQSSKPDREEEKRIMKWLKEAPE